MVRIKENPDGSKELDGTPEELAEFERRRRGDVKEDKKDKKKLLLEEAEDLIRKVVAEELEKRPITQITLPQVPQKVIDFPIINPTPIVPMEPWDPYKITWGSGGRWIQNSNDVSLQLQN